MNQAHVENRRLTESGVHEDLQRQPHLLMKLAENSLTVAESLRDNYFRNTARLVTALRRAMHAASEGERPDPILDQKFRSSPINIILASYQST